ACFRFLRFFQHEFAADALAVPAAVADLLNKDKALMDDYKKTVAFYARLTNPYICLSVADLAGQKPVDAGRFIELCKEKKVWHRTVALFPPSSSREIVLCEKLFPLGLPPDANLMKEFIRKIRSGEVDLRPRSDSGWYDYQVYAVETLLLPGRGE